jgi:TetR/AcrR family transcriptional regulator
MRDARNVLIKAAMACFAQKGYAGCSIREICQAAGVTKPVLYYHFHSKEELYQELMLDIFSHTKENYLRLATDRGSLRDGLIHFVSSELRDCKRDPNSVRMLFRMMFSPEGEFPYFNFVKEFRYERKVVAEFIRSRSSTKRQTNFESAATALMGMMLMAILENLFTRRPTLTRRNAEKFVDLLLSSALPIEGSIPNGKTR